MTMRATTGCGAFLDLGLVLAVQTHSLPPYRKPTAAQKPSTGCPRLDAGLCYAVAERLQMSSRLGSRWLCPVLALSMGTVWCPSVSAADADSDLLYLGYESILRSLGYSGRDVSELSMAANSDNYAVRSVALRMIGIKFPKDAIPLLRNALNDKQLDVRATAAEVLNELGDKSGLAQIRKDYDSFIPAGRVTDDLNSCDRIEATVYNQALTVGVVLAEMGDDRAYYVAKCAALSPRLRPLRFMAIKTLARIARTPQATLKKEGIDPIATLTRVASQETDEAMILQIYYAAGDDRFPLQGKRALFAQLLSDGRLPYWAAKIARESVSQTATTRPGESPKGKPPASQPTSTFNGITA